MYTRPTLLPEATLSATSIQLNLCEPASSNRNAAYSQPRELRNITDTRDELLGKDLPAPLAPMPSSEGKEPARSNGWKICATGVSFFVIGSINSVSGVCGSIMQVLR
jgi:hypothetical protein